MNTENYPRSIVAAVQAAPSYFDVNECISRLRHYTTRAKESGASLVVFSESFIPGFPSWVHMLAPLD
ncbi:MAG: carbon-nitrogen hydrolase family protein, partial [Clostridiaceae bacterium]|nr:carbon-nitrogen hydrolase family protein [Clostridiaceae bacterium]